MSIVFDDANVSNDLIKTNFSGVSGMKPDWHDLETEVRKWRQLVQTTPLGSLTMKERESHSWRRK